MRSHNRILILVALWILASLPAYCQKLVEATVVVLPPSETGLWRVQMAFSGARDKQWLIDRYNMMLAVGHWQGRITRVRTSVQEVSAGGTQLPIGADVIGEVQSFIAEPNKPFPIDAIIAPLAELKSINIVYFGGSIPVTDRPGVWKNGNITVKVSNSNGLAQFIVYIDNPNGSLTAPSRGPQDIQNRLLILAGLCLLATGVGIVVYTVTKSQASKDSSSYLPK